MTKGYYLLSLLSESIDNAEDLELKENTIIAEKYIKEKLELYLENSIKQYNNNKEKGTDEFICRNFLNSITTCIQLKMIPKYISTKELNKLINWLWQEVK